MESALRTLLIDCDSLVYASAKAHEYELRWDDDLWTLHANLEPAIQHLTESVEELQEKLSADAVIMALSDYTDPWRKRIMPSYKTNRKDVRKPVIFRPLREFVHEKWRTFQRQGLEGDDCLGILLTRPDEESGERICVSLDKDMKTLPGKHYNMEKGIEFERDAGDAAYFFYTQILTGDSTDGYKGCAGVGPKGAEKILAPFVGVRSHPDCVGGPHNCEDEGHHSPRTDFDEYGAWQAIVKAYAKAGLGEEEAIRTARVARILRHGEYNYTTKEVILWNPPSSTPR